MQYICLMSINREKLLQQFRNEYQKLNENQRLAVDKIEGPVMVIAGPGTGKTQILAARIGKILLDTDTSPSSILCLTYTEAGALAMRRRLLSFIGSDAYKVHIHTFHAFCNDIIQDNLSLFEKRELNPISDLERIEIMKNLIDALPKDSPLKRFRQDAYYEIKNLNALFGTMKKEGWTPQYLDGCINTYLDSLPERPQFIYQRASGSNKKGDPKLHLIQQEQEKMSKLRAAIHQFPVFQRMMNERRLYDFDDMINWVIGAFKQNPGLLQDYQERFQYILVDEFQDTSGTQNELVSYLINYWDKPNVFVVGDDDQSIYRFQGANIQNMESFSTNYADDLVTVVLTNNYRSTQPILDISKSLIGNNQERLINKRPNLSKELLSSHPEISLLKDEPRILMYQTVFQEKIGLTLEVEKILASGAEPGKIAIIAKENKFLEELAELFRSRNIPAYTKRSVNLLDVPFTANIIYLLRYLAAEHDTPFGGEEMLFRLLHFEFFGISPLTIARMTAEVADKRYTKEKTTLREYIALKASKAPRDLFDTGIDESLKQASVILEKLIGEVPNQTLQSLLDMIIREAGVLQSVMKSPEKIWRLHLLTSLYDFVKAETRRKPDLSVGEFIDIVDLLIDNSIAIPVTRITGSEKGVNLLTAHGSKGLEFEYVFLSGCSSQLWEKKKVKSLDYKIPDTVFSSLPPSEEGEELRRLFYVALTRAQKFLAITYAGCKDDGKDLEPSKFISEILDVHPLEAVQVEIDPATQAEFSLLQFESAASPEIEKMEEEFIDRILAKFVMNVTALNNFLQCPLRFYFNSLIRIPSGKNENLEFGSAIHFALQRFFEKMSLTSSKTFPDLSELIRDFEWHMFQHRESFTQQAYERRMAYGADVLTNYYNQYAGTWNTTVLVERSIKHVVVRDIPLKGKLDKLEFSGRQVNVVDYKTGKVKNATAKLKGPSDDCPEGGDYWRQAVFYKILIDNDHTTDWEVVSTEFDFVEPNDKKEFEKRKIVIQSGDIEKVTGQIVESWNKIQSKDFYTGCGESDCEYCNFVKTNKLYMALHEPEEMEEPDETATPFDLREN